MNTKRFFLLRGAASLAALGGMLTACKEEVARLGDAAPELAALDLHGNPAKLAQWRGKPLYLNFWSAGCAVCLNEMPRLETLSRQ
ncbi:MAG: TlpA family protein disulfide reductase, partial [Burkholderiaceae bacterium]|nr:TlpA family protein disulfide reductase [Burkholderiaceae bacterium]